MELIKCFPPALRQELEAIPLERACNIRLFAGRPCLVEGVDEEYLSDYIPDDAEVYETAQRLCGRMLRLSPGTTSQGFITLENGHRMGLCGQVIREPEGLVLRGIGSLCVRVAHEIMGCGKTLAACVRKGGGVLAVGKPGTGKTTMLRDAVRLLSDGGLAVGLADERGEVAACLDGVPQLDVGMRTHVADGCPKAEGLRWLLRALCPDLLAMDELYGPEECLAVREAAACGVPVLATAHAGSAAELCARQGIRFLLTEGVVSQVVFLHGRRPLIVAEGRDVLEAACQGR